MVFTCSKIAVGGNVGILLIQLVLLRCIGTPM